MIFKKILSIFRKKEEKPIVNGKLVIKISKQTPKKPVPEININYNFPQPKSIVDKYYWDLESYAKTRLKNQLTETQKELQAQPVCSYDLRAQEYKTRTQNMSEKEKTNYRRDILTSKISWRNAA